MRFKLGNLPCSIWAAAFVFPPQQVWHKVINSGVTQTAHYHPEIPPDTCLLRYGSDEICRPATPTGCILSGVMILQILDSVTFSILRNGPIRFSIFPFIFFKAQVAMPFLL